jgi:hypothetical protein
VVVLRVRAAAQPTELVPVLAPVLEPVLEPAPERAWVQWRSPAKEPPRLPARDLNTIQYDRPAGEM